MSNSNIERAAFIRRTDPGSGERVPVHFNPASLQFSISNTLKNAGQGDAKKQHVSQTTGKLTMDLVFDTTHSGEDVRVYTSKIARFMEPRERIPPVVEFEWGMYSFQGMVEGFKETIDFFSADAVPLRASVNLTLVQQDQVFDPDFNPATDTGGSLDTSPVVAPGGSASDAAGRAGDPRAARAIAAANGQESLRFGSGDGLLVGGGVELGAAASFSAGAGAGVSGGAFAGLSANTGASARLNPGRLSAGLETGIGAGVDADAGFGLDGSATIGGSASLRAEVGAGVSLRARIQFDEE